MIRDQIGMMVNDVIDHTAAQVKGLRSVDEVREAGRQLAGFSPAMAVQERRLKSFMYERLYYHPEQISAAERARDVVARLFAAYAQDARLMPADWQARLPAQDPQRSRTIADFIAGMSDRFAMQAVSQIYGERPVGLINV
jgi:dGTPase